MIITIYKNTANYIDYIKNQAIYLVQKKNDNVNDINKQIINIFLENVQEFLSANSLDDKNSVY